jgi:hypothetical protein
MAKNKEFVDANNGKIKQGDRHRVYPPVGKFMGGITKPKPFVYLDELKGIPKKKKGYDGLWIDGNNYIHIFTWDALIKAAAKIAKGE